MKQPPQVAFQFNSIRSQLSQLQRGIESVRLAVAALEGNFTRCGAAPPQTDVARVLCVVEKHFLVCRDEIFSVVRTERVCLARWVVMWLLRNKGMSSPEIGRILSKDHGTIIWGVQSIEERINQSKFFSEKMQAVLSELHNDH